MSLESIPEDDDSLNLQNVRIKNKKIEEERMREELKLVTKMVLINLSSIWPELLQYDKDLKLTYSLPMLTMNYSSAMNHSDFQANEVKDEISNTQNE